MSLHVCWVDMKEIATAMTTYLQFYNTIFNLQLSQICTYNHRIMHVNQIRIHNLTTSMSCAGPTPPVPKLLSAPSCSSSEGLSKSSSSLLKPRGKVFPTARSRQLPSSSCQVFLYKPPIPKHASCESCANTPMDSRRLHANLKHSQTPLVKCFK